MQEQGRLDDKWLVDTFMEINEKLGALPDIKEHLASQNDAIAKTMLDCADLNLRLDEVMESGRLKRAALEVRLLTLERVASVRAARWQMVVTSSIKIIEGLTLAYLLWRLWGAA